MIGVDEVGRGSWAGPLLVVAARQTGDLPSGLTDSKLLTKGTREVIYIKLRKSCNFGEGWVSSSEIDKIGLAEALRIGAARALKQLKALRTEEILIDGSVNFAPKTFKKSVCRIRADKSVQLVAAASVHAKVTRDRFMANLSKKHPLYGFDRHVGYGTRLHQAALRRHGAILTVHRMSYRPLKDLVATQ